MTAPPVVLDRAGRPVPLGPLLAAGGEGAVYTLRDNSDRLAKVYHPPVRTPERREKLQILLALDRPELREYAAWPTALVYDPAGRAEVGFLMARMPGCQPIQRLYSPAERLRAFPQADWRFAVHVARNLAAAFEEVHKAGCLVGDVNQSNALVSADGFVRLIDCDSFEVRADVPLRRGHPLYVPPELQRVASLGAVDRTEAHDRFGLAVLIYQLLFVGRHPYAGRYRGPAEVEFTAHIAEYRFAQGPLAATWGMAPPPFAPTFDDIPDELRTLFRRAFERGGPGDVRPHPREWIGALKRLAADLARCPPDGGHWFWRGAAGCVWCRFSDQGVPYYDHLAPAAGGFTIDEARIGELVRRIEAATRPDFPFDPGRDRPAGRPLPPALDRLRAAARSGGPARRAAADALGRAERDECRAIDARAAALAVENEAEYRRTAGPAATDLRRAEQGVRDAARHRFVLAVTLGAAAGFGVVLLPFGFRHAGFALAGSAIAAVFGVWLAVHAAASGLGAPRRRVRAARAAWEAAADAHARRVADAERRRLDERRAAAAAAARGLQDLDRERAAAADAYRFALARETTARRNALLQAEFVFRRAARAWSEVADRHAREFGGARRDALARAAEYRGLPDQYRQEYETLAARAAAGAATDFLRSHTIAAATIPQIDDGRKRALARHGILTAGDVREDVIRHVDGFGAVLTARLLAWRDELVRNHRPAPGGRVPAAAQPLRLRYTSRRGTLLRGVEDAPAELSAIPARCRAALQALTPEARAAAAGLDHAAADLAVVTSSAAADDVPDFAAD